MSTVIHGNEEDQYLPHEEDNEDEDGSLVEIKSPHGLGRDQGSPSELLPALSEGAAGSRRWQEEQI